MRKKAGLWLLCAVCLLVWHAPALAENVLVRTGGSYTLAIDNAGKIWGWGDSRYGQVGVGERKILPHPVETAATLDGNSIADIQCGNVNTLFLMKDGSVYTCGSNGDGQQGLPEVKICVTEPTRIPDMKNIVQVACGFGHCLALDSDGHVWAWGRNHVGQVGNGTRSRVTAPIRLELENIRQISCGGKYSMALDSEGRLYGWGESDYGQLGIRSGRYVVPTCIDGIAMEIAQLECGGDTAFALDCNGAVWGWGRNDYYQLGRDDVGGYSATPVRVALPEEERFVQVVAYNAHTLALTDAGDVWIWGATGSGQTGLGAHPWRSMPLCIMKGEGVQSAGVGSLFCCLVKQNGQVTLSGFNKYSQMGLTYNRTGSVFEWVENGLNLDAGEWRDPRENKEAAR